MRLRSIYRMQCRVGVNPNAIEVMKEAGVDISGYRPKLLLMGYLL